MWIEKPITIIKSRHKNVRLLNKKMIKEKLTKKDCNYMVWLRKQQRDLWIKLVTSRIGIECEKSLNINI